MNNHLNNPMDNSPDDDGIDRRGFLKCMAWAGAGTLCVVQGGVLKSFALGDVLKQKVANITGNLSFVQISDSHIGFNKAANPDVTVTLRAAIAKINALAIPPAFVLHTGDLTQLSKPDEFDTLAESLKSLKTDRIHYVPGEHDVLNDNGQAFRDRFGRGSPGRRLVQLRSEWRALYCPGQCLEFEGRWTGLAWTRPTQVD